MAESIKAVKEATRLFPSSLGSKKNNYVALKSQTLNSMHATLSRESGEKKTKCG